MNVINNLERRFHGRGIRNLTVYIIACYIIGYVLYFFAPNILNYLYLEPALILRGQIWRLVTWVLSPPSGFNLFTIIMLLFYYQIGVALEQTWGSFRYTFYVLSGLVFTIIGAFILFLLTGRGVGGYFSTYYISMSIFLAFATTNPDMRVMLYFIFPIKIKWLAILDVIVILYNGFVYIRSGLWAVPVAIVASLFNFLIFFLTSRNFRRYRPKEVKRRKDFQKAVSPSRAQQVTKHKCAICGITEEDDPDMEFRFCSKCKGNYEYCQKHLFTHKHVQ